MNKLTETLKIAKEAQGALREAEPNRKVGREHGLKKKSDPDHSGRSDRRQVLFKPKSLPRFDPAGDQLQFIEDLECVIYAQGYILYEDYIRGVRLHGEHC